MVYINMEMPKNCEECRFSILKNDDAYCTAIYGDATLLYEDDWPTKRPQRCPLKPECETVKGLTEVIEIQSNNNEKLLQYIKELLIGK